ncbi:integrator complex subunit 5 omd [Oratosquilla oratoria]|uniref:integrator complex subunit 5 omd n=1 Tax=Oratosquilla oratoria TaxID=337810 RepID=UPI003F761098
MVIPEMDSRGVTSSLLLTELDRFLQLSLTERSSNSSAADQQTAAQTALFLLQHLPPARPAALTYLAQVLTRQVEAHAKGGAVESKAEGGSGDDGDDDVTSQLQGLLLELMEVAPQVWPPLVSSWAMEQLGRWSRQFGPALCRPDATLEEVLAVWLACPPAKGLMALTVACIAHHPDTAIAALLQVSATAGPSFDWVVAHVGCSFPSTVIHRVLALGLASFAANSSHGHHHQLVSVNNILAHLADKHRADIQRALHSIFLKTFSGGDDPETQAAVPFLLRLVCRSMVGTLLEAFTSELHTLLTWERVVVLAGQVGWWIPKFFPSASKLQELIVHLLLDTATAAPTLLTFLVEGASAASPKIPPAVAASFNNILENVVEELCGVAYWRRSQGSPIRIPFLSGIYSGSISDKTVPKTQGGIWGSGGSGVGVGRSGTTGMSLAGLLRCVSSTWPLPSGGGDGSGSSARLKRAVQVVTLLSVHQGAATASSLFSELLRHPIGRHDPRPLLVPIVMSLMSSELPPTATKSPLTLALVSALEEPDAKSQALLMMLQSLDKLLDVRGTKRSVVHPMLVDSLLEGVPYLARIINTENLGTTVVSLLAKLPLDRPLAVGHVHVLAHATVFYLLTCLHHDEMTHKLLGVQKSQKILQQLSRSVVGQNLIIRLLVESAFRPECSYLFGAKPDSKLDIKEVEEVSLINANHTFDSWVKMPQSHTTIFHAGIIGKGVLRRKSIPTLPPDLVTFHTQLLVNTISLCCRSPPQEVSGGTMGINTVALMLVELISPDIMFNGFPWPEEYIKFTFERDLSIKKTFDTQPVAWALLELVAQNRSALCFCSVLVRALTAALIAYWATSPVAKADQAGEQLATTVRLLQIMVTGQFVPRPLSVLPQLVGQLAPHEVLMLMQDLWTYMRDNVPSPDRWVQLPSGYYSRNFDQQLDPKFIERLRLVLQVNVQSVGHLLPTIVSQQQN